MQCITFTIDNDIFGVDVRDVREIKAWTGTNELPNAPAYSQGVINLRGKYVPIIDLRARIGHGRTVPTRFHVIIVVSSGAHVFGVLVDAVSDILDLENLKIRKVPEVANLKDHFLQGLVDVNGQMVSLLNVQRLMDDTLPLPVIENM
jgi:purine-binding chemotaxis protein CheW